MNLGRFTAGRNDLWFGAIAAVGLAVRLVTAAPLSHHVDDPDHYVELARGLAHGEGFVWSGRPTAYRPPLYPLVLAPLVAVLGTSGALGWAIALLHAVLGSATVLLTGVTARRWGLGLWRARTAALIVALDPVAVAQSRMVMTETLTGLLLALALLALTKNHPFGPMLGGVSLGLSALCRPSTLPAAGLIALGSFLAGPGSRRERLARAAILAAATVAPLAPWAVRNALVLGEPVWTTTHGGYTLALANNPIYYAEVLDGPAGAVWTGVNQQRWFDSIGPTVAGLSEPGADRRLYQSVWVLARARPGAFARASLARLGRFWSVAPAWAVYPWWVRAGVALWTVPLWLALCVGLTSPLVRCWPRVAAPLMLLGLTFVHAFYWTDLRMRAPLIPAVALVAATSSIPRLRFFHHAPLSRDRRSDETRKKN